MLGSTLKTRTLIIGGIIFFLIIIFFLVRPLFQTGLKLSINPSDAVIKINGNEYSAPFNINLKPNKYNMTIYANNYKKTERTVVVKKIGRTRLSIDLEKLKPLIQNVPYDQSIRGFIVEGSYNDFQEPTYSITFDSDPAKKEALSWLNRYGVNTQNSIIRFVQDGG